MAAAEDYTQWRMQTNGGIKYRFLGMNGGFGPEEADIEWKGLFRSVDLMDIVRELFPPPTIFGNVAYPQSGTMPGFPTLGAKKLSFRAFDEGKPLDPFTFDVTAPIGTYIGFVELTVSFGSVNRKQSDPEDPRTFLEITSTAGGEFIYAPPEGTKLQDETNTAGTEDEAPGEGAVDAENGKLNTDALTAGPLRANRSPILPSTVIVPTTEWTVKWKQIPLDHFKNVIIHRLRIMNGRVNSLPVTFLYDAYPETLLFLGHTYSESYSWREDVIDSPPIDVEIKLLEKRVVWRGIICGHNHVWEPGIGWRRMWVGENSDERPYRLFDLNFLFKV